MMLDLELPHDELGQGPAVVLLHAGVADRSMWSDLLPAVAGAGYRVIAIDLPGFGEAAVAAANAPHTSVLETLDALDVVLAAFIGVSFGGAVALRVAAVSPPRIGRLMLVSTPAPGVEPSAKLQAVWEAEEAALQGGDIDAAVRAVVDAWTLPDAPPELRDRVARMQRRAFELQAASDAPAPDDDPLEHNPTVLETLDIPTLVAHGEFDMPDFVLGAQQLSRQLRGGPVVIIPGAGHLAPLEQPQAFRDLALKFLRETSAPTRDTARAMWEENVETVRRVYEGVSARLEVPRELFDPDYEFDNTELWPDLVEVLGFDAAQEAMREYWETFEAYHVEIEEVIYADEGRVVDVVRDGGRMRGTDAEVWNRFVHVWTLRDGRIVRLSVHTDRNRALEAAGLSE